MEALTTVTSNSQVINICFCKYCYYYDAYYYYYYYLPAGVKISQVQGGEEEQQEELLQTEGKKKKNKTKALNQGGCGPSKWIKSGPENKQRDLYKERYFWIFSKRSPLTLAIWRALSPDSYFPASTIL